MNWLLFGIAVYIVVQLIIGLAVSRRVRGEEDYILAGRNVGFLLATFSIFATWFGAETCMGAAGEIYTDGLSAGSRDPFGYTLCLGLMALVFAVPLRRRRFNTLGDLFRTRYSPGVERLAVVLMVPTSVLWSAAQIRAFGQVLSATGDIPLVTTMTIATMVVIVYSVAGGMLADVVTDFVQGILLILGIVVLLIVVVSHAGGIQEFARTVDASRLNLFPSDVSPIAHLETWLVPICGSVVAQELISRVLSCKTPSVARRSCFAATALYFLIALIPTLLGLVGPHLLPGLDHAEQFLPRLAQAHLAPFLYVVFAGALVSAILSTIDSALLAAASLTCENLVASVRPQLSSRARLRISRGGVIVFGLIAWVLALESGGIFELVEEASAFGSSGVFTVVVFGLFTRLGGPLAAAAALITGMSVWLWGHYFAQIEWPYVSSLLAAIAAYAIISSVGWALPTIFAAGQNSRQPDDAARAEN
ncbi:MAG: sodium:solute symporter family protein [Phycisphaerales bacterium]|nr:sodium:solute symporter family protein [Phycisphaerales bacterium]